MRSDSDIALKNGEDLLKLRTDFNVTQTELAAHLGYYSAGVPNRSMIARMEKGYQKLNYRHIALLKDYFDKKKIGSKEWSDVAEV